MAEKVEKVEKKEKAEKVEKVEKQEKVISGVEQKFEQLATFLESAGIGGTQAVTINEATKAIQTLLPVQEQRLPMFIVVSNTVYTYIQVHVVPKIREDADKEKITVYLNELNEEFTMLKYFVNGEGSILLQCSIPSYDDGFDSQLIVSLVEQVQLHLENIYPKLMHELWE